MPRASEVFTEVVEQDESSGSDNDHGARRCIPTNHPLLCWKSGNARLLCQQIWQSANVISCFPSEHALMTGSRENCMPLRRMHRLYHIDIDTASISRNIHVDVPIVADAKEALSTKMTGICGRICRHKDWHAADCGHGKRNIR